MLNNLHQWYKIALEFCRAPHRSQIDFASKSFPLTTPSQAYLRIFFMALIIFLLLDWLDLLQWFSIEEAHSAPRSTSNRFGGGGLGDTSIDTDGAHQERRDAIRHRSDRQHARAQHTIYKHWAQGALICAAVFAVALGLTKVYKSVTKKNALPLLSLSSADTFANCQNSTLGVLFILIVLYAAGIIFLQRWASKQPLVLSIDPGTAWALFIGGTLGAILGIAVGLWSEDDDEILPVESPVAKSVKETPNDVEIATPDVTEIVPDVLDICNENSDSGSGFTTFAQAILVFGLVLILFIVYSPGRVAGESAFWD